MDSLEIEVPKVKRGSNQSQEEGAHFQILLSYIPQEKNIESKMKKVIVEAILGQLQQREKKILVG